MRIALMSVLMCFVVGGAFAQNSYTVDGKSCDPNQGTKLSDLCPSGYGLPSYGSTQEIMDRNPNNANMIVDAAIQYGVDPKLALAVSAHEGAMSSCAGSFSGVRGPMQLTKATGKAFGQDRDTLAGNIKGGMATLKGAIDRCGGDNNIRCLADKYNGSTESQRRNWTNDVTRRLATLQNATIPQGCNAGNMACQSGDFPGKGSSSLASNSGVPSASSPPEPSTPDISVSDKQLPDTIG